jgi:hypothetical protein
MICRRLPPSVADLSPAAVVCLPPPPSSGGTQIQTDPDHLPPTEARRPVAIGMQAEGLVSPMLGGGR